MKMKVLIGILASVFTVVCIICFLLYNGIIWFNNPPEREYPVRGVDVSSHQGIIDWDVLSRQNIDFAFIKATEGSSFQDERFLYNFENASNTGIKAGAYHFFSYDSTGAAQADNFISIVPRRDDMLPPVVDIEFYGDKEKNLPGAEETRAILDELLLKLEDHYNKKPVIYATQKSYDLYIRDNYSDYPVWIRNVIAKPYLPDGREWTFWQYSHRKVLDGYEGREKYIDMNVFNGTKEEFEAFCK